MPALQAYVEYHKTTSRVRRLHDFTIHVYAQAFAGGVEVLAHPENRQRTVPLNTASGVRRYRLDKLTYHARDVYPDLLRSVLLVRLVSAHELFLIDAVREVGARSTDVLKIDTPIDLKQNHVITLCEEGHLADFLTSRIARHLSAGGLKDIERFYQKRLGFSVAPSEGRYTEIDEIHDRRHLHVHADGKADELLIRTYNIGHC